MKHISHITMPRKASMIVDDPSTGGDGSWSDGVVAILNTVFDFVLTLVGMKNG